MIIETTVFKICWLYFMTSADAPGAEGDELDNIAKMIREQCSDAIVQAGGKIDDIGFSFAEGSNPSATTSLDITAARLQLLSFYSSAITYPRSKMAPSAREVVKELRLVDLPGWIAVGEAKEALERLTSKQRDQLRMELLSEEALE